MTATELYDTDFFEWTRRNAELLRKNCLAEADLQHIAEEIEDMGRRDQREVRSYMIRLLAHLLKWKFQPELRSSSWSDSIEQSRTELEGIFLQSPSLERHARESIPAIYSKAVKQAVRETGIERFPAECPFRIEEIWNDDFWPE
jgi:hypothetical protein